MAKKKDPFLLKYSLWFWLFTLVGIGGIALWMTLLVSFGKLPEPETLSDPKSNLATEIYSSDGKLFGKYFRENRSHVSFVDLSPHLVNALVATEDERYFEHSGIDFKGLARALLFAGTRGGASTITQQLAKMLFHERARSYQRILQKMKEWIIAVQLERLYTKEEIITMYLNKFDFVNNAVGIKSAALVYFGKKPIELSIEESAMLIGMAKNPALFNPLRRPETTLHRRNVVLAQMLRNERISQTEFDSLKTLPIELNYNKVDHKEGAAPYFREILRAELKRIFNEKDDNDEYVLHKTDGSKYNIYRDGLKIYTTLDSRMQDYAAWSVKEHLSKELQPKFTRDLKRKKNAPFDWRLSGKQVLNILHNAMRRTSRYRVLAGKECGNCHRRGKYVTEQIINDTAYYKCSSGECIDWKAAVISADSIVKIFDQPVKMRVFSWDGEIDTIMSPMDSIKYYKGFIQAGFMAMDPRTGYIKAWVGGINKKHFSYDHVKQGKRQVGSTFKPIVYALAIANGYSPCKEIPNQPVVFEKEKWGMDKDWSPKNSDGLYGCLVSLKYGLANSLNTITAWIMKQLGPEAVVDMARKMGITSKLDPVPALCLGVADLSVYELVGAYSTFANKGVWMEPSFLTRIEDKNGTVIKEFRPNSREAMSEEVAYAMLDLTKGVVDGVRNDCMYNKMRKIRDKTGRGYACRSCGTGMRIRGRKTENRPYAGIEAPMSGKTGTTQNNSDGWFMGISPELVAGAWVGAEDRSVRFIHTADGQGANTGLPIYGYFMNKVYADKTLNISQEEFEKPSGKMKIELDCYRFNQSKINSTFGADDDYDFTQ